MELNVMDVMMPKSNIRPKKHAMRMGKNDQEQTSHIFVTIFQRSELCQWQASEKVLLQSGRDNFNCFIGGFTHLFIH